MPSDDSDHRIDQLLELAGLDPQTSSSILARRVLESINSRPPPLTDTEFGELLQQISERPPNV
ncbi:hypothetical protein GCM10011488_21850 [Steroidobacter agaridevorans]|nr:hypothetical protein GCM10011488_21850 [Steroidobacter agaridevorans]